MTPATRTSATYTRSRRLRAERSERSSWTRLYLYTQRAYYMEFRARPDPRMRFSPVRTRREIIIESENVYAGRNRGVCASVCVCKSGREPPLWKPTQTQKGPPLFHFGMPLSMTSRDQIHLRNLTMVRLLRVLGDSTLAVRYCVTHRFRTGSILPGSSEVSFFC